MKSFRTTVIASLVFLTSLLCCHTLQKSGKGEALKDFQNQVDSMLPSIGSLTGIQDRRPVKVDLLARAELGKFFERTMEIEYPDEELNKRGSCFALIGLLPQGYNLENGFLELLKEHAGALYDPHSKILIGVSDLPPEQKRDVNDKMIVSHELTHALQDRVINIVEQSEKCLKNVDYEYALRAVIEGMASSVMIAYAQNLPYSKLPDLRSFWRTQLSQAAGGTLGNSPRYVTEYLMSPYAEGGAFIQAWQNKNPGKSLNEILKRIPASSEQVLHFEKYVEEDEPTNIDLSVVRKILPREWQLFYANTLGEFDLLEVFQLHQATQTNAVELAAGWEGCKFEAYKDKHGGLVLLGSSIWESKDDAKEFYDGFSKVLGECRLGGDYAVLQSKERVNFVIGSSDKNLRMVILKSLARIPHSSVR